MHTSTSAFQALDWSELLIGAPHLGRVVVPIEEVVSGQRTEGWFDLVGPTVTHKNGKPIKAQVHVKHCSALIKSVWTRQSTYMKGIKVITPPAASCKLPAVS